MEKALDTLTDRCGSRSEAVRYADLRTYREVLIERAQSDAERLEADPDDRAEMLAIERFMGVSD
ncbi:hypothetical protein J4H86_00650 [Spiractinospora alimapuensis]|uniref:hypothetical protein n=1 Tax=Spiractinospora alimapuensis TaxID=2820884 RepID=UPI001F36FC01|nr:hypothetical protein [Spiractinospora alimapuensis]QVQ52409.1 hypothetical protein J4H86_00650 [Spiractinospora alimapuensis]